MYRLFVLILPFPLLCGCESSSKNVASPVRNLHLDSQEIEKQEPESLAETAQERVWSAIKALNGDPDALALSMPQHWRAIYTTGTLDGQVRNGGFHQYFWNFQGKLNQATAEDLSYIEAVEQNNLFTQAQKIYGKYDYQGERQKAGKSFEGFSKGYAEKRFEELDKAYYKLPQSLRVLQGKFIKKHVELYAVKNGSSP
jgi:hypothetical protein